MAKVGLAKVGHSRTPRCVVLNWQRTLIHNSRLQCRIWQWKWRNFSPGCFIKSTTIFSWKFQDLMKKLQAEISQKGQCDTELYTTNCSETNLQEEVSNANYIHNEETTTNEVFIKDVQDAQSRRQFRFWQISMRRLVKETISHNRIFFPRRNTHWPGM